MGDLGDGDLQGWEDDGSVASGSDLIGQGLTVVSLDMRGVATSANAPTIEFGPSIQNLACWGPGPRPRTLIGVDYGSDGAPAHIGILDLETREFVPFEIAPGGVTSFFPGALLPDGKRAIVVAKDGTLVYDLQAKTVRKLEGCVDGQGIMVSRDGSTLVVVREVYDGDVWLGEAR